MADDMSIDKKEREGSEDSMMDQSPTPEADNGAPAEAVGAGQTQKRKGGRKPI